MNASGSFALFLSSSLNQCAQVPRCVSLRLPVPASQTIIAEVALLAKAACLLNYYNVVHHQGSSQTTQSRSDDDSDDQEGAAMVNKSRNTSALADGSSPTAPSTAQQHRTGNKVILSTDSEDDNDN